MDHINEVIITAQQAKIPFSQISGNIESDIGVALPSSEKVPILSKSPGNLSNVNRSGFNLDTTSVESAKFGVGTSNSFEAFETPDSEKYNPTIPTYPIEELDLAGEEIKSIEKGPLVGSRGAGDASAAFSPGLTELEREERDKRWAELRAKQEAKRFRVPAPLKLSSPADGTRWSKDDIPESEKYSHNMDWSAGSYLPPERQALPKTSGAEYFVTTPLVAGMVQLRNVLQGAIEYVRDWFTYITQMIYDLLGTDIGWMQKKTDTTVLKNKIIQIIFFIKAIMKAIEDNGLECGEETNYDIEQLRFISEHFFTKQNPDFDFTVLNDGTLEISPTSQRLAATKGTTEVKESIPVDRQEQPESSIIIKTCFKDVSADELVKAREWIADFEERGGS